MSAFSQIAARAKAIRLRLEKDLPATNTYAFAPVETIWQGWGTLRLQLNTAASEILGKLGDARDNVTHVAEIKRMVGSLDEVVYRLRGYRDALKTSRDAKFPTVVFPDDYYRLNMAYAYQAAADVATVLDPYAASLTSLVRLQDQITGALTKVEAAIDFVKQAAGAIVNAVSDIVPTWIKVVVGLVAAAALVNTIKGDR